MKTNKNPEKFPEFFEFSEIKNDPNAPQKKSNEVCYLPARIIPQKNHF